MCNKSLKTLARARCFDHTVSRDGTPIEGRVYTVPARGGVAVRLRSEQCLTVVNPSGHQVCDLWGFAADDLDECLSMAHLHTSISSIFPKVGDGLVTNLRRTLLEIAEDTFAGRHDTLIASCDEARYLELGCQNYHDNCADNLKFALEAIGLAAPFVPAPLNLWMNIPVDADGSTQFAPPVSHPGDQITFRAKADAIVVMSACPQDLTPVNGEGTTPDILQFDVTAP